MSIPFIYHQRALLLDWPTDGVVGSLRVICSNVNSVAIAIYSYIGLSVVN